MTVPSGTRSQRAGLHRRPQLPDEVAKHLRAWIMSGKVKPGDYIRLDETAAELGVSVTPVREALLTLRGEGLVELVPRRGYVVSPLTRSDIADIFWLQSVLAVELAQRAARRITPDDFAALESAVRSLRHAVAAGDAARIEDAEFEFHRQLNLAADSTKLAWVMLKVSWYAPHRLYSTDPEWGGFAVANHEALIEALRAGDLDGVAEHTRALFTDAAQRLMRRIDQEER